MSDVSYFVKNENTLGYVDGREPHRFCPQARRNVNGSLGHDWRNGPVPYHPDIDVYRVATLVDFDLFLLEPPKSITRGVQ